MVAVAVFGCGAVDEIEAMRVCDKSKLVVGTSCTAAKDELDDCWNDVATGADESPFTATDSDDSDEDKSVIGTDRDSVTISEDDDDKSVIGTDWDSDTNSESGGSALLIW
jgi:hypothetical protein